MRPLRYLGVAALCAGLNNAVLIGGACLGFHYALSLALSFALVVIFGYLAHSRITFAVGRSWSNFGRYAIAMLANLPMTFVLLAGFDALGAPMLLAAPSTTAATLICNYVFGRWAFARSATVGAAAVGAAL